jgi:hypothetical protein
MVFLIGIPLQIIVFLVFGIKINITISKKENPSWIKSIKSKTKQKEQENQGQDQ